MYIARILKTELFFNGLRVIIISLPHRADDAIRHNPDLIGRTHFYWRSNHGKAPNWAWKSL